MTANACAARSAADNAGHASESHGPLRLSPNHPLWSRPRTLAPPSAGVESRCHGLPPTACRARRAADRCLPAFADEPVQVPVVRPRRSDPGSPHRTAARPPARSPRVAGRWAPFATPAPHRRAASFIEQSRDTSRLSSSIAATRTFGRCPKALRTRARRWRRQPCERPVKRAACRSRSRRQSAQSATSSCAAGRDSTSPCIST